MIACFDRAGRPVTDDQMMKLRQDPRYCVIKQEEIGPVFLSTVWLGIDHAFGGDEPLIFETMTFNDPDGQFCRRYPTEAEARAGHDLKAEEIRAAQKRRAAINKGKVNK